MVNGVWVRRRKEGDLIQMVNWKEFMLESNKIEGEIRLNPGDEEAFDYAMLGINNEEELLILHKMLTKHLKVHWSGKYREVNIQVGSDTRFPVYENVPILMKDYFENIGLMTAWEAHNEFERIHPFRDFNGRTGRLLWLQKAINRGYTGRLPFLQAYYYQTLEQYQNKLCD